MSPPADGPTAGDEAASGNEAASGRRRYVERARAGMREAALDAVEQLLRDRGWRATRMADVATRAGVSRQTLYQMFGSREALAQEYVLHEADRFLRSVEDAVRGHRDDPLAAVEATLDAFLTGAAEDVMIKAILGGRDNEGLLPLITTRGLPVIDMARQRLTAVVHDLWPDLPIDDVRLFSESIVRLAISHVTAPDTDPQRAARDISQLLAPFVRQVLGRAASAASAEG